MGVPGWVHIDPRCVCIDDAWTDLDTDRPTTAPRPIKGERYTISLAEDLGNSCFVVLAEMGPAPDMWNLEAFRPLTEAEQKDSDTFDLILKDASALWTPPDLERAR